FYALASGGWRDYGTLLHPPYTLWHLSYVVVGAGLAPVWRPDRLGESLVAFFLALGIGAHALDELKGRPLRTRIPAPTLVALAALLSLAQRRLSAGVRAVRRTGAPPEGPLFAAAEDALRALATASVALAVALVLLRAVR